MPMYQPNSTEYYGINLPSRSVRLLLLQRRGRYEYTNGGLRFEGQASGGYLGMRLIAYGLGFGESGNNLSIFYLTS